MEEQAEFNRTVKELRRDTTRGVTNAIRFFHNRVQEKERRAAHAEQKLNREEAEAFRQSLKTPGEKSYEFMLDSGRDISYHTLDPNTDLERLKGYLDGERLQYCIRESSLDQSQEMVYFTKDRAKVTRALEKALNDTLKQNDKLSEQERFTQNWQSEQERVSPNNKLGWTPSGKDYEGFERDDSRIYQSYDSKGQIEWSSDNLPTQPLPETLIQPFPLDNEISIEKLTAFMKSYDLTVAFENQKNGGTQMYLLMRSDKLSSQKAALKAAFLALEKNPDLIRKVRPTMKEALNKAKVQEKQLLLEASKKAAHQAKDLGQDIGRGVRR
ncbi:hypothetical protein GHI93_00270 [Lactococcus hircilactis]|uniref:Uncharacterized protein n=1 Tax=Lactococcus hircilactis TaxID=1494462 RepID=A0A7X1Z8E8_9LACT|nr:hypothetical protein [Lactococcus hircilactis]MQW38385.1 hypothetical protein [Lactococcus hircilactis]